MAEEEILSAIQKMEMKCSAPDFMERKRLRLLTKEDGKKAVQEMKTELVLILDFLRDSVCSGHDKLLSYMTADVVEFAHDARNYVVRGKLSNGESWLKFKMSFHLRKLKAQMFQLEGEGGEPPLRSLNAGEGEAAALEGSVHPLLHRIILPQKQPSRYSKNPYTCYITGVAGIGKTTLAKELYNHAHVAARFHYRAWVCVSGIISGKEILMELIKQVGEGEGFESLEEMDNPSLQHMLRKRLFDKPYFIVLDDADEDPPYLRSVFKALPKGKASRLLITTQSHKRSIIYYDYIHSMKFLDDDESWELFLKSVFCGKTSERVFPKHLKQRARKMLKQCGGLPLAIIEVGSQLAEKRESGSEWEELLEPPLDFSRTIAALESTYRKLSPEEKSVFMCLSFFEEETTIRVKKLLPIGIMLQLITNDHQGRIALGNLKDISLIEFDKKYAGSWIFGPDRLLQIRIVFHRLSVAKAEDEINFEILRNKGNNQTSRKICHRVIYCSRQKFNYSTKQDENLVSLFFRGGGYFDASPSYLERLERLVVLDVEGFGLKMLPDTIGLLIRLRYLRLRNNHIQKLPDTFSCLKSLEVLDIAQNFMVEVPDIIWELDSLCHLYMSDIILQGPLKMEALAKIETLTYISVDNSTYELSGLQMMNKLHRLGIEELDGKSDVSKLFKSLAQLYNLRTLILRGFRFKKMPLLEEIGSLRSLLELKIDGLLTKLPSAENFPPVVRYLTLVNSSLDEDPMPVLEKLSQVWEVRLENAYTGQQMTMSHDGFIHLRILQIKEFWHLRNIQVGELAMPDLEQLKINDCPYLYRLHVKDCKFLKKCPEIKSQLKKYEIV